MATLVIHDIPDDLLKKTRTQREMRTRRTPWTRKLFGVWLSRVEVPYGKSHGDPETIAKQEPDPWIERDSEKLREKYARCLYRTDEAELNQGSNAKDALGDSEDRSVQGYRTISDSPLR